MKSAYKVLCAFVFATVLGAVLGFSVGVKALISNVKVTKVTCE